jgi:hypothetical protein
MRNQEKVQTPKKSIIKVNDFRKAIDKMIECQDLQDKQETIITNKATIMVQAFKGVNSSSFDTVKKQIYIDGNIYWKKLAKLNRIDALQLTGTPATVMSQIAKYIRIGGEITLKTKYGDIRKKIDSEKPVKSEERIKFNKRFNTLSDKNVALMFKLFDDYQTIQNKKVA